jgi:hypothetical protein
VPLFYAEAGFLKRACSFLKKGGPPCENQKTPISSSGFQDTGDGLYRAVGAGHKSLLVLFFRKELLPYFLLRRIPWPLPFRQREQPKGRNGACNGPERAINGQGSRSRTTEQSADRAAEDHQSGCLWKPNSQIRVHFPNSLSKKRSWGLISYKNFDC